MGAVGGESTLLVGAICNQSPGLVGRTVHGGGTLCLFHCVGSLYLIRFLACLSPKTQGRLQINTVSTRF